MTTITLVQAAQQQAPAISLMTAQPMNVALTGLTGGGVQFGCTNPLAAIQAAKNVDITYDAAHGGVMKPFR